MSRLRRARRCGAAEEGFTLIEVIVTIAVLAVGVFAGMSVFTSSLQGADTAQRLDVGVATAAQAIEELRAMPYDQLAVSHSPAFPPPSDPDHPAARLVGGSPQRYAVPGGTQEELVAFDPGSSVADYEVRTVGTGSAAITLRIYRFVSWRDEECPIADLGELNTALSSMETLLTTTRTTLTTLLGPGGSLTAGISDAQRLVGGGLLGSVPALQGPVVNLLNQGLAPVDALLTQPPLLAPVQTALDRIDAVTDPATGRITDTIDLCDMRSGVMPAIADIASVTTALTALNPVLATTRSHVGTAASLMGQLAGLDLAGLLGATGQAPAIVAATTNLATDGAALDAVLDAVRDAGGDTVQLGTLISRVATGLDDLARFMDAPDTTHNTKRISVAVVADPARVGLGPRRPVWMSTVVSNPADGLL